MGDDTDDTKKLAKTTQPESLARRTLIRAFEGQIVAKVQEDGGQDGDHQAPMTLLKNPDGTPRKFVAATTDRKQAEDWVDAINRGVPVAVQLHRAPTEDELEQLAHELPVADVPRVAARPAPALPPPMPEPVEDDAPPEEDERWIELGVQVAAECDPGIDRDALRRNAREVTRRPRAARRP